MGDKIGEGHFGLVYSCVDDWNNTLAAKVMSPLVHPKRSERPPMRKSESSGTCDTRTSRMFMTRLSIETLST
jgi:hypothetical protein